MSTAGWMIYGGLDLMTTVDKPSLSLGDKWSLLDHTRIRNMIRSLYLIDLMGWDEFGEIIYRLARLREGL